MMSNMMSKIRPTSAANHEQHAHCWNCRIPLPPDAELCEKCAAWIRGWQQLAAVSKLLQGR
jgi:predicted nucleic acid-binding Zn ribbon protein